VKVETIIKEIQKKERLIAKERDALEDIILNTQHLKENCDMAIDSLQRAVDKLSETI
jgi:hypothetical protein